MNRIFILHLSACPSGNRRMDAEDFFWIWAGLLRLFGAPTSSSDSCSVLRFFPSFKFPVSIHDHHPFPT